MLFQNIVRHTPDMSHTILKTSLELCTKTAFKLSVEEVYYHPSTKINS